MTRPLTQPDDGAKGTRMKNRDIPDSGPEETPETLQKPHARGFLSPDEAGTSSRPDRYFPSNGTEGALFIRRWCERCERDAAYRAGDTGNGCQILAVAMCGDEPAEWIYKGGEPACAAFECRTLMDPALLAILCDPVALAKIVEPYEHPWAAVVGEMQAGEK